MEGLLRHFELSYVFGDERDLILRRTLYQETEVYLYPLVTPPHEVRGLLVRMVETANDLRAHARFYNSVTENCTSVLREHAKRGAPRLLPSLRARAGDAGVVGPGALSQGVD